MRFLRVLSAGAGLSLLLITGCGRANGTGSGPGTGPAESAYAPDDVVVRVERVGGFISPQTTATTLPTVTVYGDGRVITQGPVTLIYPGPSLPNVLVQRIGATDVRKLARLAVDAGVPEGGDLGRPSVMDDASTRFTVATDGGPKSSEAYALEVEGGAENGLNEAQRASRIRLRDLYDALTDLPTTLGEKALSKAEPYQPTRLVAVSTPWVDDGSPGLPAPGEIAWPGPALPGESLGTNLSCVTVTGDQLTAVLAAARTANARTPWTSGESRWTLSFRPLLPGETDCSTVRGAGR